jgi:hypothetical protein
MENVRIFYGHLVYIFYQIIWATSVIFKITTKENTIGEYSPNLVTLLLAPRSRKPTWTAMEQLQVVLPTPPLPPTKIQRKDF